MNFLLINKQTAFRAIYMCALITLMFHADAFAQRPDPFEGANSAIEQLLAFFRSTMVKGLCGLAITGAIVGALFKVMPWKTAFITMGASVALLLVPEFVAFLTADAS